ncbi:hypothetical protein [Sphingobacterium puteale]|uniref:hypothetical protein n=1 Tax=Sphingobacterium puteale TaxID=2420510 RepID=UPI0015FEF7BB|nr:hypothetical protein [Sphingobacterium puteale]
MKHLIGSVMLLFALSTAFCQSKISYGINAGYTNAGSLLSNKRSHNYSFRSISGITAGVFVEIPLIAGILFNLKSTLPKMVWRPSIPWKITGAATGEMQLISR